MWAGTLNCYSLYSHPRSEASALGNAFISKTYFTLQRHKEVIGRFKVRKDILITCLMSTCFKKKKQ